MYRVDEKQQPQTSVREENFSIRRKIPLCQVPIGPSVDDSTE
jgi:hypothetical protein